MVTTDFGDIDRKTIDLLRILNRSMVKTFINHN